MMSYQVFPAILTVLIVLSAGSALIDGDDASSMTDVDDAVILSMDIGLTADDPDRNRVIAGLAVIALLGSLLAAIYYTAMKEGL